MPRRHQHTGRKTQQSTAGKTRLGKQLLEIIVIQQLIPHHGDLHLAPAHRIQCLGRGRFLIAHIQRPALLLCQKGGQRPGDVATVRPGQRQPHGLFMGAIDAFQLAHLTQDGLGIAQQLGRLHRRLHALCSPPEQADPKLLLQFLDGSAQVGLADIQILSCLGHTAHPRNFQYTAQLL